MDESVRVLLRKARWVAQDHDNRNSLSVGQLLSVAIVLNRPDWIAEAGFSLASALDRLGADELDQAVRAASEFVSSDACTHVLRE